LIKKKKALLITYAFSPIQAPESFLSAKCLAKIQNFDIDILTIETEIIQTLSDNIFENYIKENFKRIYRAKKPKWLTKKLFDKLRIFHIFPDRFQLFNKNIVQKAIEIDIEKYDVVISWSQWHSIHLAALKLKKIFPEIRWLAHFSDPWADNPFLAKYLIYKPLQIPLERKILKSCDAVNFTTKLSRDLILKKYNYEIYNKSFITNHSYERNLFLEEEKSSDKFTISYFGNFYNDRNPISFFRAIEAIHFKDNNFLKDIKFRFIGRWIGKENWQIERYKIPKEVIEIVQPVNYSSSLAMMKTSDLLLIIDGNFKSSVFFPSKLVDYMGAKKPILAITPPGSCHDIVSQIGGYVISNKSLSKDPMALARAILKARKKTNFLGYGDSKYDNSFISKQFEMALNLVCE